MGTSHHPNMIDLVDNQRMLLLQYEIFPSRDDCATKGQGPRFNHRHPPPLELFFNDTLSVLDECCKISGVSYEIHPTLRRINPMFISVI